MKQLTYLFSGILILFVNSCRNNQKSIDNETNFKQEKIKSKSIDSVKDIYIGKIIYAGGELYDYEMLAYYKFNTTDSLSYGIYKFGTEHSNNFIFTLEKFIKIDEMDEWMIFDTLNIKNYNTKDFKILENVIGKKVSLEIYWKNTLLKKWIFNKKKENLITINKLINKATKNNSFIVDTIVDSDLNLDKITDKIITFKNKKEYHDMIYNKLTDDELKIPVYILLGKGDNNYEAIENNSFKTRKFYEHSEKIVTKEKYFTYEFSEEKPNVVRLNTFVTFKYDFNSKSFLLYKFSRIYELGGETIYLTTKDFGTIKFENFNVDIMYDYEYAKTGNN